MRQYEDVFRGPIPENQSSQAAQLISAKEETDDAVCRIEACAVVKVCLVLSGESRPRWKKAGKTIRLPSSERSEGTTACG